MKLLLLTGVYALMIFIIYLLIKTRSELLPYCVYQKGMRFAKAKCCRYYINKTHHFPYITNLSQSISEEDWGGYELYIKIGNKTKYLTFSHVRNNIGRLYTVFCDVVVDMAIFYHPKVQSIVSNIQLRNLGQESQEVCFVLKHVWTGELIYLNKNLRNRSVLLETSNETQYMKCYGAKVSFYKKENGVGMVAKLKLMDRVEQVSFCFGKEKLDGVSIAELYLAKEECEKLSIQFMKKYLTPKRKAMLMHIIKKCNTYTFDIDGKEKYFSRKYFEDSFMINNCDPYYPIWVVGKWGKDEGIVSRLLLDMGTNIQLIQTPVNGKHNDYLTVMATNINRPNSQLKTKSKFAVKDRVVAKKVLTIDTGIVVDDKKSIDNVDILQLYPKTYMYVKKSKNQLYNYMLREKLTHTEGFIYKGQLTNTSTSMRDFFVVKIECDDDMLCVLVNDYLPKQIMSHYKKEYHFQSLQEEVFGQDIRALYPEQYQNNYYHLLQHKQYAKLYHYLLKSVVGVEIVGDVVQTSCGASTLPYVKIKVHNTTIEKYQKDGHCVLKCNQIMYHNVGYFKIKK